MGPLASNVASAFGGCQARCRHIHELLYSLDSRTYFLGSTMDISWLGHSCVRIQSNDATLIADPYAESTGLSLAHQRADIVTISHEHPNHSHYAAIEGSPRVLRGPGEYEIGSFYITGMGTDRKGLEEENVTNTVFVIHAEGLSFCHSGDLNHPLSPRQLEGLGQPDILFVPADGVCTLGPSHSGDSFPAGLSQRPPAGHHEPPIAGDHTDRRQQKQHVGEPGRHRRVGSR